MGNQRSSVKDLTFFGVHHACGRDADAADLICADVFVRDADRLFQNGRAAFVGFGAHLAAAEKFSAFV